MSQEDHVRIEYRLALGVPGALLLGLAFAYFAAVFAGVERGIALDGVTIALPIGVVAAFRGVRQAPQRNWSLEFGALLTALGAIAFLSLRAISLALDGGVLFYFAIVSSSVLVYLSHRLLRRMGGSHGGAKGE